MTKSIETAAHISAINTAANALNKNVVAVANTARNSTQDAGRVHVGGGMMRF